MREEEESQAHIDCVVCSVKVLNLHCSLTLKGFEKVFGSATHSLCVRVYVQHLCADTLKLDILINLICSSKKSVPLKDSTQQL